MANVVVGVTGGIAAYKSAPLIRLFSESGHNVQVVATENAFKFIGKTTLEALSKNPVSVVDPDLFTDVDQVKHIAIAKSADLIVVAPATASFIAKISAGIADDLLTTTVLAAKVPVVLAPAMHSEMWENAATMANIATLESRGYEIVAPGVGRLTGDDSGVGRLAEPKEIFEASLAQLKGPLTGIRICVTAGGTREPIDAVRYVGNYSSGKQGVAFATEAKHLGAEVHLIAVNLDEQMYKGFDVTCVGTAAELGKAVAAKRDWFGVLIMAAAVSDYSPVSPSDQKLKRSEIGSNLELQLRANPDILLETTNALKAGSRKAITIGFAAEADPDLATLGKSKLASKGCDYVIANDISGGSVFGSDQNKVLLISGDSLKEYEGSKSSIAKAILMELQSKIGGS
ncbi:unannotated protein [freshwater metagenome]|uniref:Unannotated protein n=1 Tax=freshwater metagenome TaxID=449393 RepID=A0A6J6IEM7_9ZZZZ|nr:bifunctional phosphopantothenoylcysteine decarboxylase/phosphopantothenate--cysteine ligase CoaBC [Actinomycetota bacterium]